MVASRAEVQVKGDTGQNVSSVKQFFENSPLGTRSHLRRLRFRDGSVRICQAKLSKSSADLSSLSRSTDVGVVQSMPNPGSV